MPNSSPAGQSDSIDEAIAVRHADGPENGPHDGLRSRVIPGPVLGGLAFLGSFVVLVVEIVAARLLAPYVGVTLETYTAIIGVMLGGIAGGAWLGGRLADRVSPNRAIGPVLIVGGLLTLLSLPLLRTIGPSLAGTAPEKVIGLTALVYLAPAIVLSLLSPLLTKAKLTTLAETGRTVGGLSALSTTGALCGSFVTGFVLIPNMRSRLIIGVVGAFIVALGVLCWLLFGGSTGRAKPATGKERGTAALGVLLAVTSGGTIAASSWKDPCTMESSYFCASTDILDPRKPSQVTLVLDDSWHSQVDLNDPTFLSFEYIKAFAASIEAWRPAPASVRALHIGGGGFTMPRYLKATRPGSDSLVLEIDKRLVEFDQKYLGLELAPDLRVQGGDGRQGVVNQADGSYDVVLGDAFGGQSVPWHLATQEMQKDIHRVLTNDGLYVLNVIDSPPSKFIAAEIKTVQSVFPHVSVITYPDAFKKKWGANFVLVASKQPISKASLITTMSQYPETGMQVYSGKEVTDFVGKSLVLTDDFGPVAQLFTRAG